MKKTLKRVLSVFALTALSMSLVACGGSKSDSSAVGTTNSGDGDKTVYKFAITHCQPLDDPFHLAYLDLQEYLESTGRFEVTIYGNQEFSANEAECMNQVMDGIVQMSQGPTSQVSSTTGMKEFYIYDYPFLFEDEEAYHKMIDSDLAQELAERAGENTGLLFGQGWVNGWVATGNSKREYNTVADLKGLKLRTAQTEITLAFAEEMGIAGIPMAFSEIYTGVQQGTIDGVITPIRFYSSMKFGEVCTHVTWDKSYAFVQLPYVNASYYNSLDAEAQEILSEGIKMFAEHAEDYAAEMEQEAIETLKNEMGINVVIPSEETMDELRVIGENVQEKCKDIVGAEFFDSVKELL